MAARTKVVVGIPHKGDIKFDTMMSLLMMVYAAIQKYDATIVGQPGPNVASNRNRICQIALQQQATHVLFIDTDMIFRSLLLDQLLAHDKPVVGVASRKKKYPKEYTIEVVEDGKQYGIRDAEMPPWAFHLIRGCPITVGTGIMLIDLEKVKDVPRPWFKFNEYWDGENVGYDGEDDYFCRKVIDAGLEVWCDPTIYVRHIGDHEY